MRGFECYYYQYTDRGQFKKNSNRSCWAGIKNYDFVYNKSYYIEDFRYPKTQEHIELLVEIINKIVPCEIVRLKELVYTYKDYNISNGSDESQSIDIIDNEFIKIGPLLDTYDQNLIILNFIRYLWDNNNNKANFDLNLFFKILKESKHREPLKKLTYANKIASRNCLYDGDHSNRLALGKGICKSVKQLKAYEGSSTKVFLKT